MIYIVNINGEEFGAFREPMEAQAFIQEVQELVQGLNQKGWEERDQRLRELIKAYHVRVSEEPLNDSMISHIMEDCFLQSRPQGSDYEITMFDLRGFFKENKQLKESHIRIKIR